MEIYLFARKYLNIFKTEVFILLYSKANTFLYVMQADKICILADVKFVVKEQISKIPKL